MMNYSPFARFHLYRNPFGELTRHERAQLAVVELQPLIDWLDEPDSPGGASPGRVVQLIGPCGHGKSTHLLALQQALAMRYVDEGQDIDHICPYIYFPEDGQQPPLPRLRPLLVDEAQRMNWWRRRQLFSLAGPLVLATHQDLSRVCQRAGRQVMTIDLARPCSPAQLQAIFNRRILASLDERGLQQRLQWHPLCLSLDQVVALQARFGSNIRLIEQHLYVAFQRFAEKGQPWLPVT